MSVVLLVKPEDHAMLFRVSTFESTPFEVWEAQKFARSDEDAAEWMREHGGSRFVKPLRCRKSVVVYSPGRRPC